MNMLKLFRWYDTLIVAEDESSARSLLREHYTSSEINREPIKIQKGTVDLTTDNGETFQDYLPDEVVALCGRGIIPDGG